MVRGAAVTNSGLNFGCDVPVQTIKVTYAAIEAIPQDVRKVVGEKVSYRLAQRSGTCVVLRRVRRVVK